MKLANIVSSNKIDAPEDFNIVDSMDKIIHGIPTLVLGYDYVCKNYPNFDILERQLAPNLYWSFKKTERRDNFEIDLNWFIQKVYLDVVQDISYVFVDPIQYKNRTLLKIVKKIYALSNKITLSYGDMLYIYGDKLVFGVDLKLLRFIGLNSEKVKEKIKSFSKDFLIYDDIFIEYKKPINTLENKVRFIPYLYSLRHDKNNNTGIIHFPRET